MDLCTAFSQLHVQFSFHDIGAAYELHHHLHPPLSHPIYQGYLKALCNLRELGFDEQKIQQTLMRTDPSDKGVGYEKWRDGAVDALLNDKW